MQATYPRPPRSGGGKGRNLGLGIVIAAAVAALVVAGYTIGYDRGKPNKETAQSGQQPAGDTKTGNGGQSDGGDQAKQAFTSTCGSCHILKDAKTTGLQGPNLDDLKLPANKVAAQIAKGGGGMPAGLLKGAEAKAVADYVGKVAGK